MSRLIPRDYQADGIQRCVNYLFAQDTSFGLGLYPTGVGKSLIIAGVANAVKQAYAPARIVMLTHNKELVEQNYEKMRNMSDFHVGVWHAGMRRKEYNADIVFAGIDTVANNPELLGVRHILLVDEAQRVSPRPTSNYQQVTQILKQYNPNLKGVGFTATDYRLGQGLLTDDWYEAKTKKTHASFWRDIIVDMTSVDEFNWFIEQGYLKRLVAKGTDNGIDVSQLRISGATHDFMQADAEKQLNNAQRVKLIVDEICENGFDRNSWLVFASGNRNAEMLAEEIKSRGVTVATLSDKTPKAERERILAAYKRYEIRCLVNNDILTTGFDHAGVDLIAVVRATASAALWVQMLGRGTRPVYADGFDLSTQDGRLSAILASGVYNCLVLDFGGNSVRLGAINNPIKPQAPHIKKSKQAGDCVLKICGNELCKTFNYATAKVCEQCGWEFPISKSITEEAAEAELVEEEEHVPDIRRLLVTSCKFHIKEAAFGNASVSSITVSYNCGLSGKFSERLIFGSKATKITEAWWRAFGAGMPMPRSNSDFMDNYRPLIKQVAVIDVYMNKPRTTKPKVVCYAFTDNSTFEPDY